MSQPQLDPQRLVEVTARVAIGIASASYGIGILIRNIELGRHGLTGLGLFRAEYVISGALYVTLTLAAMASYHHFLRHTWRHPPVEWRDNRPGIALVLVPLNLALHVILHLLPIMGFVVFFGSVDKLAELALALGAIVISAILLVHAAELVVAAWDRRATHGRSLVYFQSMIAVSVALSSVGLYTSLAYPSFDSSYGGGRRPESMLVLSTAGRDAWSSLGLEPGHGSTVGPIVRLLESDGILYFKLPEGDRESYALRSDLIVSSKSLREIDGIKGIRDQEDEVSTKPGQPQSPTLVSTREE